MSALPRAHALLTALALASAAYTPRDLAPEGTTLSPHGEDAPESLVKELSNSTFKSCKEVAAAGYCVHPLAKTNCAQSCGPIDAGGIHANRSVTSTDKPTSLPKFGTPTGPNGDECQNKHHYCASGLCYKCWKESHAGHWRYPKRCADYMKETDWIGSPKAYCMEKTWESKCDEELSGDDSDGYRGCQSKTRGGYTCQKWTSQYPHQHSLLPDDHPNMGLGNHNYCRNPDGMKTIWCYTTASKPRWDYCDPLCSGGSWYCGGKMQPRA